MGTLMPCLASGGSLTISQTPQQPPLMLVQAYDGPKGAVRGRLSVIILGVGSRPWKPHPLIAPR